MHSMVGSPHHGAPHAASPGADPSAHHAGIMNDPASVSLDGKGGGEELIELSDEIDDLAERLAQVERLTSMLTPEYTHSLQKKLQSSFSTIEDRMLEIDGTLLTEAQKRCGNACHAAARHCCCSRASAAHHPLWHR